MSRIARIATTSILLDRESNKPGVTVDRALAAVIEAGKWKPDLVALPEEINMMGLSSGDVAKSPEPIPDGPTCRRFADAARKIDANLLLPLRESENGRVFNTAAVLNRKGELVGKYRKTHLVPGESQTVDEGSEYPVFELDFGRVGATICMDIHYPEIFTILALQGADVIANLAMWRDYTGDMLESIVNARAIDNQVYFVTSHYVEMPFLTGNWFGHARIVDPFGRTRADTSHRPGVAFAEVDLDEGYEYWVNPDLKRQYPTLKECFLGMRRPETYGIITRPNSENAWRIQNPILHDPPNDD